MKTKYLAYAILPALAFGSVGASVVSAHGWFGGTLDPDAMAARHTEMFTEQANLLGVGIDDVKNAWAAGKTIRELAQEKGITDEQLRTKMQELHAQRMKILLQTLVTKGIITQAQADARLQAMQTRMAEGSGKGMRGFGRHFMF
jgi:hypothetical protein